jgi:hypothetical protein
MLSYVEMFQVKIFLLRAFGFLCFIYPEMQDPLIYHFKKLHRKIYVLVERYPNFTQVSERFLNALYIMTILQITQLE